MKAKRTLIILSAVLVAGIVAYVLLRNNSGPTATKTSLTSQTNMAQLDSERPVNSRKSELVIGNPTAKVSIIEYVDFKCPSCNVFYHEAEQEIKKNYIDKGLAKIVIRNVPYIAPDSTTAAEASYCAGDQGKFADYHDGLLNYIWNNHYSSGSYAAEHQTVFSRQVLVELARFVGMNETTFANCLDNRTHKADVEADIKEVETLEVRGTPFFLIGGQGVVGPQPYTVFKTLIELELKK